MNEIVRSKFGSTREHSTGEFVRSQGLRRCGGSGAVSELTHRHDGVPDNDSLRDHDTEGHLSAGDSRRHVVRRPREPSNPSRSQYDSFPIPTHHTFAPTRTRQVAAVSTPGITFGKPLSSRARRNLHGGRRTPQSALSTEEYSAAPNRKAGQTDRGDFARPAAHHGGPGRHGNTARGHRRRRTVGVCGRRLRSALPRSQSEPAARGTSPLSRGSIAWRVRRNGLRRGRHRRFDRSTGSAAVPPKGSTDDSGARSAFAVHMPHARKGSRRSHCRGNRTGDNAGHRFYRRPDRPARSPHGCDLPGEPGPNRTVSAMAEPERLRALALQVRG